MFLLLWQNTLTKSNPGQKGLYSSSWFQVTAPHRRHGKVSYIPCMSRVERHECVHSYATACLYSVYFSTLTQLRTFCLEDGAAHSGWGLFHIIFHRHMLKPSQGRHFCLTEPLFPDDFRLWRIGHRNTQGRGLSFLFMWIVQKHFTYVAVQYHEWSKCQWIKLRWQEK